MMVDMPGIREAGPSEVTFILTWHAGSGSLKGELQALNVCDHAVRLSGKPSLNRSASTVNSSMQTP
jgi:hypothetical protein